MRKQHIPFLISLDLVLGLILIGCGEIISNVANAITSETGYYTMPNGNKLTILYNR